MRQIFNLQAFDQRAWKLVSRKLPSYKATDIPQNKCSHAFCTLRKWQLKCCNMGLNFLPEGLTGFWLCESLDSQLPTSRWITDIVLNCTKSYTVIMFYFTLNCRKQSATWLLKFPGGQMPKWRCGSCTYNLYIEIAYFEWWLLEKLPNISVIKFHNFVSMCTCVNPA